MPTIDLRRLIMLLSVIVALLTFANSFYASYQTQRDLLMRHTLEGYSGKGVVRPFLNTPR